MHHPSAPSSRVRSAPPRVAHSTREYLVVNALVVFGLAAAFVVATYPLLLVGLTVGLALPPVARAVVARVRRRGSRANERPNPTPAR